MSEHHLSEGTKHPIPKRRTSSQMASSLAPFGILSKTSITRLVHASGPRRTCRSTDQLLIESTGCGPFCYCLLMAMACTRGPATPVRPTLGAMLYTMYEVVAPGLEAKV
ncbi:hypothetical protein NW760_001065 [Fusarium oxysporum]|nr:hypothetical protein NW760_001065 [Fusarium oxysporum]